MSFIEVVIVGFLSGLVGSWVRARLSSRTPPPPPEPPRGEDVQTILEVLAWNRKQMQELLDASRLRQESPVGMWTTTRPCCKDCCTREPTDQGAPDA